METQCSKAASAEAIVPGGAAACCQLHRTVCLLNNWKRSGSDRHEIIRKVCRWLLKCIGEKGGAGRKHVCETLVEHAAELDLGYTAVSEKNEDVLQTSAIGPTKVLPTELQNASSVASVLLTSRSLIVKSRSPSRLARNIRRLGCNYSCRNASMGSI